jgi:opacity protein-like surface antigen
MRTKWMQSSVLGVAMAVLGGATAQAQTDVAASLYGAFSEKTTDNNVSQSPANSAGGLLEVRRIFSPIAGLEATYSFNNADRTYRPLVVPAACPSSGCIPLFATVKANAHELTADWVASVKIAHLRPFALAGGGVVFNVPGSGQSNATSVAKPVFVYGAGLDWGLLPHIGIRLQYRGNLYNVPNLSKLYTTASTFTQTAEPMAGIYFRL